MPKKPHIDRRGKGWLIFPSADEENYFWAVFAVNHGVKIVASGKQRTYGSAFRAVRNYIKDNQNAVYGSNEAT
jgi:hypothetical protein